VDDPEDVAQAAGEHRRRRAGPAMRTGHRSRVDGSEGALGQWGGGSSMPGNERSEGWVIGARLKTPTLVTLSGRRGFET
jgi:hypothetical protein